MNAKSYEGVAVIAPVTVPYQKQSSQGAAWFFGKALAALLRESGLTRDDVDGLSVSSFTLAPDNAVSLVEHLGLELNWLEQVSQGGASGVVSLRRAARAVQCGDAEVIACIGADTRQADTFRDIAMNFSGFSNEAVYPYGAAGPNAPFSLITQAYMDRWGARREDFGRIAVSQRYNANHYNANHSNSNHSNGALLGDKPLSMEDYLEARPIAGPLHLYDCVLPCAGADGYIVTTVERARALGLPRTELLAAEERHNAFADDPVQWRGGWQLFREALYSAAALGPEDMDCLQTYDDYPVIVMLQMEGLGFCAEGEAPAFVNNTALTFDGGGLPHNTNGGQLSCGQAGCGYLGVVENLRQVLQCSGANQVPGATVGLVSGYGMVNYDRGVCSAAAIFRGHST